MTVCSLLASGGSDRTIRLWPLTAASPSHEGRLLRGHADEISSLAFSSDRRTLLSSLDYTARVWAIDTGQATQVLTGPSSALSGAVFSPDGQRVVATCYDYTVHAWDVGSDQPFRLLSSGDGIEALLLAFSPDGEILACVTRNQTIALRHVASGAVLQTLRGHQREILTLAFSPTAPIIASSGWDGTIRLWAVASGACLQILRVEGPYAGMDITGATGLSEGQRASLRALGAVEDA